MENGIAKERERSYAVFYRLPEHSIHCAQAELRREWQRYRCRRRRRAAAAAATSLGCQSIRSSSCLCTTSSSGGGGGGGDADGFRQRVRQQGELAPVVHADAEANRSLQAGRLQDLLQPGAGLRLACGERETPKRKTARAVSFMRTKPVLQTTMRKSSTKGSKQSKQSRKNRGRVLMFPARSRTPARHLALVDSERPRIEICHDDETAAFVALQQQQDKHKA
jgi:hypothetical protein